MEKPLEQPQVAENAFQLTCTFFYSGEAFARYGVRKARAAKSGSRPSTDARPENEALGSFTDSFQCENKYKATPASTYGAPCPPDVLLSCVCIVLNERLKS